jgi:hypothetical protein
MAICQHKLIYEYLFIMLIDEAPENNSQYDSWEFFFELITYDGFRPLDK